MTKNLILIALSESAALRDHAADLLLSSSVVPVDPKLSGRVERVLEGARELSLSNKKIPAIKLVRGAFDGDVSAIRYLKLKFPFVFNGSESNSELGLASSKYIVEAL